MDFTHPKKRQHIKKDFLIAGVFQLINIKMVLRGSSCPYGASGDKDGNIGLNIWDSCYMCTHFKPREGDIKVIDKVAEYYKNEKDRLIHMLQYASTRLRELENDVEKYIDKHGR